MMRSSLTVAALLAILAIQPTRASDEFDSEGTSTGAPIITVAQANAASAEDASSNASPSDIVADVDAGDAAEGDLDYELSSDDACCCDEAGGPRRLLNSTFWSFEYLTWWNKGRSLPPLVTGGDPVTPFAAAGVLPGARVLFGDGDVGGDVNSAGRFTAGLWLDDDNSSAVVFRAFGGLGDDTSFADTSDGSRILAVPFIDAGVAFPGQESALVAAYSGGAPPTIDARGSIQGRATNEVFGGDMYVRGVWHEGCNYRLDLLAGYQFSRINDGVQLSTAFTRFDLGGAPIFTTDDLFNVRNDYHAATLGFVSEIVRGPTTIELMGKVGLGNMRQRVAISGRNTVTTGGVTNVDDGGIFAQAQASNGGPVFNIGNHVRDVFVCSPEATIKVSHCVNENVSFSIGYTMLYWNRVALAGDQIDRNVNRDVLFDGPFLGGGGSSPSFAFRDSDFWVQSIDFGVTLTY